MSNVDPAKMQRKLVAARMALGTQHPFFGDLAFGMPFKLVDNMVVNGQLLRAGTDGKNMYFHPEFVDSMSVDQLIYTQAHEVLHPALHHTLRRGDRDPAIWNRACDVVVNYLLDKEKVGTTPPNCVHRNDLYNKGDGKVEKIYDLLVEEQGEPPPQSGDGESDQFDHCIDTPEEEKTDAAMKWRSRLAGAIQSAKAAGKCPASFEAVVDEMLQPKVNWKTVLRNFCITAKGDDRTWSRANRRYRASGIYLPGSDGVRANRIAVLGDNSGSVNNAMVAQAFAEIRDIHAELRPEVLDVMCFDVKVQHHAEYGPDDELELKRRAYGGTIFRTAFEFIEENGIEPDVCIVLTDLECADFGPPPGYPVLWISDRDGNAPWGQVLIVKE